jgi:hypothetical protein
MLVRFHRFQPTLVTVVSLCGLAPLVAQSLANQRYSINPTEAGAVHVTSRDAGTWTFRADFSVIVAEKDPKPAMRPAGNPMNPMLLQIGCFRPQAFTTLVALLLADTPVRSQEAQHDTATSWAAHHDELQRTMEELTDFLSTL